MHLIKFMPIASALLFVVSCNQTETLPDKQEATKKNAKELPIDGLYTETSKIKENLDRSFGVVGNDLYVRFQKGVAFYEDRGAWGNHPGVTPGKVFLKDIRKINHIKYKGIYLVPKYGLVKDTSFNVTILVDGNNLKINIPQMGLIKMPQTLYFNLEE